MKIKILSSFHVFVPTEGRNKKIAFVAGTVLGPDDMPADQSMQDWVDKGLAADVVGTVAEVVEAGSAV